jgi:3-oxoacyl-[acyl-carrier-protein] synthase III
MEMTQPTDAQDATLVGPETTPSFFERPGVEVETIPVGPGVRIGIERVSNPGVGIGGAYGTWGDPCPNSELASAVEHILGRPLESGPLNVGDFGFFSRHHVPDLTREQHLELELAAGERFLREAISAVGWRPDEVDAVLLGITTPACPDYVERIAARVGVPESSLKVSVHKACDGSVAALNLALNPALPAGAHHLSLARELKGKKVLVGGIEGLSRVMRETQDQQALQLFGNGAGIFGLIPGETMQFIAGESQEVYDEEGLLQVRMTYPHSRSTLLEVQETGAHSLRFAGLQHEPAPGAGPVVMAGPMGMVKLFVRNGVTAVRSAYGSYREKMSGSGMPGKDIAVAIVHHANLKINLLKLKQLQKEGISMPMPWLLTDFGNVSAASAMIAFLRKLRELKSGDHVLFDGFGAGSYYDVVAVELGHR